MGGMALKVLALVAALILAVAACGGADPTATPRPSIDAPPEPVRVITGSVIIADFARNVGGDAVSVESLIPSGGDAHTFRTTPSDGIKVSRADVILLNGSGLDDNLVEFVESSRHSGSILVEVSEGLTPKELLVRELGEDDHGDEEEEGEDEDDHGDEGEEEEEDDHHGGGDPHFWQDPIAAIFYVERIRDALIEADPARSDSYRANADAYIQRLRELDTQIRETLSTVPAEHRTLVSFHDAFGYFGARYDFKVISFVGVHGGEPTPGDIAGVIHEVEDGRLPAIFGEPQFAQEALQSAASESGIEIGAIRSETFDETAPDYITMMRANAKEIVRLLG